MPKDTFFNLPAKKRKRIETAALNEFAYFPYLKSNTNRIIENADISKGSFYQYFENKKDLYKYLMKRYGQLKMEYMLEREEELNKKDFFEKLEILFLLGIEFARDYPLVTKMSTRLIKGDNEKLKQEIYSENRSETENFYQQLLQSAAAKGEINESLDIQFLSYLITSFSTELIDYFFRKDYQSEADNFEEILSYLDQLIFILKNGIQSK
jgi:AcrR family transcriptional regulator